MIAYMNVRERVAITAIIEEMKEHQKGVDEEELLQIVANEALFHGIQPEISLPFARQILEGWDRI